MSHYPSMSHYPTILCKLAGTAVQTRSPPDMLGSRQRVRALLDALAASLSLVGFTLVFIWRLRFLTALGVRVCAPDVRRNLSGKQDSAESLLSLQRSTLRLQATLRRKLHQTAHSKRDFDHPHLDSLCLDSCQQCSASHWHGAHLSPQCEARQHIRSSEARRQQHNVRQRVDSSRCRLRSAF